MFDQSDPRSPCDMINATKCTDPWSLEDLEVLNAMIRCEKAAG